MKSGKHITRRAALMRLGLGTASTYVIPSIVGLSAAHAQSAASDPSPASAPSPPSAPSPVSAPTPPSAPSPVSRASSPSRLDTPNSSSGPSAPRQSNEGRANSGPSACRQPNLPNGGQMTRRDYELAQQAIAKGDARPLSEVINTVQSRYPGRIVRVGFSGSTRASVFQIRIVSNSGAVVSVSVNAKSGAITGVQNC